MVALPLPLAGKVVLLHQQKETLHQVRLDPATHPAGAAHKPALALAPFGVQAFHNAGFAYLAITFVDAAVLIGSKETRVGRVAVRNIALLRRIEVVLLYQHETLLC